MAARYKNRRYPDLKYKYMRGLIIYEQYQRKKHYLKSSAEWTSKAIVSLDLCTDLIKSTHQAKSLEGIGNETVKQLKVIESGVTRDEPPPPGRYCSSGAALLMALLMAELESNQGYDGSVLVPEAKVLQYASEMCEEQFLAQDVRQLGVVGNIDGAVCVAWWRMSVLISRDLVKKRSQKKQPVYELLPKGREMARALSEARGSAPVQQGGYGHPHTMSVPAGNASPSFSNQNLGSQRIGTLPQFDASNHLHGFNTIDSGPEYHAHTNVHSRRAPSSSSVSSNDRYGTGYRLGHSDIPDPNQSGPLSHKTREYTRLPDDRLNSEYKHKKKKLKTATDEDSGGPVGNVAETASVGLNPLEDALYTNDKGQEGVVLLVDVMECGGERNSIRELIRRLERKSLTYKTKKLAVGDYAWIWRCGNEEVEIPLLVERKRADDLASSMVDLRYIKQQKKMLAWKSTFNNRHIEARVKYVVEGTPEQYAARCADGCGAVLKCGHPTVQQVKDKITEIDLGEDFDLVESDNLDGTVQLMALMTKELERRVKNGDFYDLLTSDPKVESVPEVIEIDDSQDEKDENENKLPDSPKRAPPPVQLNEYGIDMSVFDDSVPLAQYHNQIPRVAKKEEPQLPFVYGEIPATRGIHVSREELMAQSAGRHQNEMCVPGFLHRKTPASSTVTREIPAGHSKKQPTAEAAASGEFQTYRPGMIPASNHRMLHEASTISSVSGKRSDKFMFDYSSDDDFLPDLEPSKRALEINVGNTPNSIKRESRGFDQKGSEVGANFRDLYEREIAEIKVLIPHASETDISSALQNYNGNIEYAVSSLLDQDSQGLI